MSTWAQDPQGTPPDETSAADLVRQVAAALRMARWSGVDAVSRQPYTPPRAEMQPQVSPQAPAVHQAARPASTVAGLPPTPHLPPGPHPSTAAQTSTAPLVPQLPTLPAFMRQPASGQPAQPSPQPTQAPAQPDLRAQLPAVRARAEQCAKCPRATTRRQVVFGQGNPSARLLILLDAPSQQDDAAGQPCTGAEGALLDRMLAGMGLGRDDVWVTYLCLCRAGERSPTAEEASTCSAWLRQQWQAVQPAVMLAMGGAAARFLTRQERSLEALRGQWVTVRDTPAMLTWSPADLIADESRKRAAWADLQQVMNKLGLRR